jgi:hypothetical protein
VGLAAPQLFAATRLQNTNAEPSSLLPAPAADQDVPAAALQLHLGRRSGLQVRLADCFVPPQSVSHRHIDAGNTKQSGFAAAKSRGFLPRGINTALQLWGVEKAIKFALWFEVFFPSILSGADKIFKEKMARVYVCFIIKFQMQNQDFVFFAFA